MRKWNIKWHLKAGLLAALLAISSAAQAAPYCSVKSLGMGGVATAYGQDSLTAFFNPATAGEVDSRWDLEFETSWNSKKLTLGDRTGGAPSGTFQNDHKWDFYGSGGINYRFGCCDEWAAGIQWNNVDNINTRYRDTLTDFGTTPARFNYRVDALTFTGAYNFDCNNTIGIGLNVYFSWLNVKGLGDFANLVDSVDPGHVSDNGRDEATGVGVTLGYLGRFCDDQLAVGLAYSTRAHMGDFKKYSGLVAGGHIAVPDVFRVGLAYNYDCATTLAADYELHRWSRSKAFSNDFNLTPGTGPRFGDSTGPGFGWKDQSVVKLGVSYCVDPCMVARLGYRWEQLPFRNSGTSGALNALTAAVVQNYLTGGLTYNWDECSELSWFAEYGFNGTANTAFPLIGGGATLEAGNVHLRAQKFATGISYGQRF